MLQGIWEFFQSEVLGMKWLSRLIGNALRLAGIDTGGRLGGSIHFFIYDIILPYNSASVRPPRMDPAK